jgi:hypothetical protein
VQPHAHRDRLLQGLRLPTKLNDKTTKYAPFIAALKHIWKKVEFVAVPIGHTGTTLTKTQQSLAQALSATRLEVERDRARRDVTNPDTDSAVRSHDSSLFKALMQRLDDLAQSRLIGIIHHCQSLVHVKTRVVSRTRARSDATPAHAHEAH